MVRATASRWLAGIACALGIAGSTAARAAAEPPGGPSIELRWSGPPECPASALGDALDRLLAGSSSLPAIRVEATVEPTADGWRILTDFDAGPGRSGSRTFHALTCRTAAQAAALAVALAVDPTVLDRLVGPEPLATPEPPMPPPVPDAPEPVTMGEPPGPNEPVGASVVIEPEVVAADRPPTEPSAPWQGVVGIAGLLDGGALPRLGGGVAALVGAQRRRLRGELLGTYRFATRRAAPADPRVGGAFSQWTVGLRGCGVLRPGPLELPLCLGADGGQTIGQGTGLRSSRTTLQPWIAAVAATGLAWPVRPWLALTLRASLVVPILRQDFAITGLGNVHRVGPVAGRGLVGLELRWP